ncbi:Uncharacterised protein [Klebsiella pneumoniae]|nr:Uncharacterised protein [Klebsiella pneumoniae]SYP12313.1 Uncharacterised protein [Klebsiella pneumoniae]
MVEIKYMEGTNKFKCMTSFNEKNFYIIKQPEYEIKFNAPCRKYKRSKRFIRT